MAEEGKNNNASAGEAVDLAKTVGTAIATEGASLASDPMDTVRALEEAPKVIGTGAKIQFACCAYLLIFSVFFLVPLLGCMFTSEGCDANALEPGSSIENPTTAEEWISVYKNAENLMKVEWEFLAGVTKTETGMGNNFGGCSYVAPAPSGGHVLTSENGLRSEEDLAAFKRVMDTLGLPYNTPVSCNPSGSNGGAMGYTQFMPREWEAGAQRIQNILGHYPNPWNAADATVMAAYLLKAKVDIAADEEMPVDEALYREAASKYYGDGDPNGKYANLVYAYYLQVKACQCLEGYGE